MRKNALLFLFACSPSIDPTGYQGVLEFEEKTIAFEMPGLVRSVAVAEGQEVAAGTVVAELDSELDVLTVEARAADVARAQATVDLLRAGPRNAQVRALEAELRGSITQEELLQRSLSRQRSLLGAGATSQASTESIEGELSRVSTRRASLESQLLDLRRGSRTQDIRAAEAALLGANVALRAAQARVGKTRVHAPESGTVLDVLVDPGEVVAAGAPIVVLGDVTHAYADVFVPQQEIAGLAVGARAELRQDGLRPLDGEVEHISRTTEFAPRYIFSPKERVNLMVRVRVRVLGSPANLAAGVPVFVTVSRESASHD